MPPKRAVAASDEVEVFQAMSCRGFKSPGEILSIPCELIDDRLWVQMSSSAYWLRKLLRGKRSHDSQIKLAIDNVSLLINKAIDDTRSVELRQRPGKLWQVTAQLRKPPQQERSCAFPAQATMKHLRLSCVLVLRAQLRSVAQVRLALLALLDSTKLEHGKISVASLTGYSN